MSQWFEEWKEHLLGQSGMEEALSKLGVDPAQAEALANFRAQARSRDAHQSIQMAWGYINGIGIGVQQAGGEPRDLEKALIEMLGDLREGSLKEITAKIGVDRQALSQAASQCALESGPALSAASPEQLTEMTAEGELLGFYACRVKANTMPGAATHSHRRRRRS